VTALECGDAGEYRVDQTQQRDDCSNAPSATSRLTGCEVPLHAGGPPIQGRVGSARKHCIYASDRFTVSLLVFSTDPDWQLRAAALTAVGDLVRICGEVLPWAAIERGFTFGGKPFRFANQSKGIFRPAGMVGAALSVKSTVPKSGLPKYDDIARDDAFSYAFQRRGLEYHDNRLLLHAIELQAPLIYFYGVEPGSYRPLWPTYATLAPTGNHVLLTVAPADPILAPGGHVSDPIMELVVRRYATVEAKKRLHQDAFRGAVLRAYECRCAICRLPRRELLDAAHILPDSHTRGEPVIPNGLALCKLHHGAYDAHLIGIRPDHKIEISERLMAEHDGPTLEHGLKAFQGRELQLPRRPDHHPNAERLEERYNLFRRAS
jgi:putative restriction endonuclease